MSKRGGLRSVLAAAAVAALGGCAHTEYQAAHECFEVNGLMVFGASGSVECVDRTAYALRRLQGSGEVAASTELPDPGELLD